MAKLEGKGYAPKTLETDDGVGWGMWRAANDDVLQAFFPAE